MYLLGNRCEITGISVRGIFLSKNFLKKNKTQTLVYLKSPKHFNVGKQKVLSFNNEFRYQYLLKLKTLLFLFLKNQHYFFKLITTFFKFHIPFRINSLKIITKTKIKWKKIKW